jgi:hypothetical protein
MYEMKLALFCELEIRTLDLRAFEISVTSKLGVQGRKRTTEG